MISTQTVNTAVWLRAANAIHRRSATGGAARLAPVCSRTYHSETTTATHTNMQYGHSAPPMR